MIPGTYVVYYELIDSQRSEADARNVNMSTGITRVPTQLHELPEVYIDEKSYGQE